MSRWLHDGRLAWPPVLAVLYSTIIILLTDYGWRMVQGSVGMIAICGAVFLMAGAASVFAQPKGGRPPAGPGLTLTSPDFEDGGIIPNKYTQAVPDAVSPKLEWTHVPAGTESFAIILHDPDVALGRKTDDVLHWMIFNIPGTATGLP